MITTDLGAVTAYAEAVAQGYTGTKEEFGKMLANYMKTAEKVAEDKVVAEQAMESAKASADRASTSEQNAKASEDAILQKLADAKTEVDASVEAGKKLKTDLDESIADSTKSKTALDESIKSANSSKTALGETVEQANALDTSLGSNIAEGTQLNKDITASGQKAVDDINSASTKALEDINTAGAAKLDAVNKAAEAIVADREQITKNKTDVASLKEDLVDLKDKKITKFYASNLGETHITDSDNGKIQDMKVFGKSEQNKTTGAQLFNMNTAFAGWVGDDGTPRNDGVIGSKDNIVSDYIPVEGNAEYSCSSNNNMFMWEYDSSKALVLAHGSLGSANIVTNENARFIIFAYSCRAEDAKENIKDLMLNKGSTTLPYEPYTGGIPSPSPEYPQEIKSVVNPTIKVCGKNLFNKNAFIKFDNVYIEADNAIAFGNDNRGFIIKLNKGTYYYTQCIVNTDVQFAVFKDYPKLGNMAERLIRNDTATPVNQKIVLDDTGYLFVKYSQRVIDGDIPQQTILDSILLMYDGGDTFYEPYKEQSIQLPITLNAIPVQSGGNVTIDGQQYIADYVDVERGKLMKRVYEYVFSDEEKWNAATDGAQFISIKQDIMDSSKGKKSLCSCLIANAISETRKGENYISTQSFDNVRRVWVSSNVVTSKLAGEKVFLALIVPEEIPLTQEEIRAFKELATYYPVTNVNVTSEQLDGYTVFNYPVSMENGWNYVKQQLNDNRDYIYDMDLQSAEAYVNSEYAVALTELEVM